MDHQRPAAATAASTRAVDKVSLGALWALHTNVQDWLRGVTRRLGATALLCPVPVTFSCNEGAVGDVSELER